MNITCDIIIELHKKHENSEWCLTPFQIDELINKSENLWHETEWEFPKGRKNYQERDIDCGIREFEEETGYKIDNFVLIENICQLNLCS